MSSRRNEYRFPWNLVDKIVCVYCWTWCRQDGESIGESWATARCCRAHRDRKRERPA